MTMFDLQTLTLNKIKSGQFGNVECAGFLCGKAENPLQVILTNRETCISIIIDIDRNYGSTVFDRIEQSALAA